MKVNNKKPLWVYLDYNVFVNLLKGKITVYEIKSIIGKPNIIFPYSMAHIEEIHNIRESKELSRYAAINNHLKLIDDISKRQYLEKDDSEKYYKKRSVSAFDIYEKISQPDVFGELPYSFFANAVTEEQKQIIRTTLNLNSHKLNNISTTEIIEHLNTNFQFHDLNTTFLEIIELAKKQHTPDFKWGIEMNIGAVFTFLDIVGYWKDSYTPSSDIARLWDIYHTGVASFCDILFSQDKKMRLKAAVAYDLYNIKTKIIDPTSQF